MEIKFGSDGLIPAIVQDFYTGEVLTLAYMNRESLDISLSEQHTCFYSRERKTLWRKGETSGNRQRIVSAAADCDGDALLFRVIKDGPACHTNMESCFHNEIYSDGETPGFSANALYQLIAGRKTEPVEGAYTSYLFEKGLDKILKKVGEETAEVIIAAKNPGKSELTYELADLAYHSLVLMAERGVGLDEIAAELAKRMKK
ncbi:MAG: bifunctional phosphoribosyl-AMP cyclohydrolase/phosphoribosyl-ATP diphosphatase HisIE [Oscillospiraceae bacterium]|nr:bifunctional phosphoribosyl-AMP cyclohydrolase/phosphoribosyl-ATP diphosphatase HisIE [Oscillospiraceae bacterium]